MIDATGLGNKNDPRMRDVEAEMIRCHHLPWRNHWQECRRCRRCCGDKRCRTEHHSWWCSCKDD